MSSYCYLYYHIVLVVGKRENVFTEEHEQSLYNYIGAFFRNKKSHLECINGTENHLHLLVRIHQSFSIADLMRDLKVATNKFIKENNLFPKFKKWQNGYAAFSVTSYMADRLKKYIQDQKIHHKKTKFTNEFIGILNKHEIEFNPDELFDN